MTCKITSGSSGGACDYLMNKEEAKVLDSKGVRDYNPRLAAQDFEAIAALNPRVEKWAFHISVSFHKQDAPNLSDNKMISIAHEIIDKMGFNNSPYLIVRHYDGTNPHFHILTSRVDLDGKTVSDKFCKLKLNKIREEIEVKYPELTSANGKKIENINTKNLKGKDAVAIKIYKAISTEIKTVKNINQLIEKLDTNHGIKTEFKYRRGSIDHIEGIKFHSNNTWITGSKVDKTCSYLNLTKRIEAVQAPNQKLVEQPGIQQSLSSINIPRVVQDLFSGSEEEYLPQKKKGWHNDFGMSR